MKIEIDIDGLIEKTDIIELIKKDIISHIKESSKLEDVIDDVIENILNNGETKNIIDKKIVDIIEEYLTSDEGKRYIIEQFNNTIADSDILTDDRITKIIVKFLEEKLTEK